MNTTINPIFANLLDAVLFSAHIPNEEEVFSLLLSYKLYITSQALIDIIKEKLVTSSQPTIKNSVALTLITWAGVEDRRNVVQAILDILPKLIPANEMNSVKLKLITKSTARQRSNTSLVSDISSLGLTTEKEGLFLGITDLEMIAKTITFIDWGFYSSIKPGEFLDKNWQKTNRYAVAPTLSRIAERFDKMSYWVATSIITQPDQHKQIATLKRFIKLMKKLVGFRNYQGAQQILSGLNMAAIQRIKHLWDNMPLGIQEDFDEVDELFSPIGNFAKYRELLANQEPNVPCIPYIAMHLRDVVYAVDGNSEVLENGELNRDRIFLLGQQVLSILKYQRVSPASITSSQNKKLHQYLCHLADVILSEEELYDRSLAIQPIVEKTNASTAATAPVDIKTQFESILTEPMLCNGFRKFLVREHCGEYLHFLRDISRFAHLPENVKLRSQQALEMMHLYLLEGESQLYITILSSDERIRLIDAIKESIEQETLLPSDLFQDVSDQVKEFLQQGKLQQFFQDPLYRTSMSTVETLKTHQYQNSVESRVNTASAQGLSSKDWDYFLQNAQSTTYEPDHVLITQSASNQHVFLLKSGVLRVERVSPGGSKKIIRKLTQPNSIVGEMSIFNDFLASASVIVHRKATVYSLSIHELKHKFLLNPDLGLKFYKFSGESMSNTLVELSTVKKQKTRNRAVKKLLLESTTESPIVPTSDHSKVLARFGLPATEEIAFACTCKFTKGPVTKPGTFYLTPQHICFEAKFFGQRTFEVVPIGRLNAAVLDKVGLNIMYRETKRRRFTMNSEDATKCYIKLLEFMESSKKKKNEIIRTMSVETELMDLTSEDWDLIFIASQSTQLTFSKEDVIIQQSKPCGMVCQIVSGSVRIEKQHADCCLTLAVLTAGEVFGEISFLSDAPASATVVANEDVELHMTSKKVLDSMLGTNKIVVLKFYHYLCATVARRILEQENILYNRAKKRPNALSPDVKDRMRNAMGATY